MTTWFAIHRCPEAVHLQRDHPHAFLLLLQVLQRARWQKKKCTKTGLEYGQAYVGDWKNAGLSNEKQYRNAKEILISGGIATFRGAGIGAEQKAELGAEYRAKRGTIATLSESIIYTLSLRGKGGIKGGMPGDLKGGMPGGIETPKRASNIQSNTKDSNRPDSKTLPEVALFWNEHPSLPKVLSFGPKRAKALRVMEALPDWGPRWREAVGRLSKSSFATGGGSTGWKADIDFLLTPAGFEKTLSGRYDNRPKSAPAASAYEQGFSAYGPNPYGQNVSVHDVAPRR